VFIVQHMTAGSPSLLPAILQRTCPLPVAVAENGGDILPGTISVAVPDLHLMLMDSVTLLTKGPKENHSRPAIDVLFRSAANAFGPRTIGVVLSGMLDDGTAGLSAIKRAGGTTVVQDPKDALYPEMPKNALLYVHPDHVVPVSQMGQLILRLVQNRKTDASKEVPEDIRREIQVMQGRAITEEAISDWKDFSLSCPDCGGPLREHTGDVIPRYRCMVGHAYSINLIASMGTIAEKALWSGPDYGGTLENAREKRPHAGTQRLEGTCAPQPVSGRGEPPLGRGHQDPAPAAGGERQ
jgi:two-component system, chemotaxis family, protein-glutamate methylesterase/glutaminase